MAVQNQPPEEIKKLLFDRLNVSYTLVYILKNQQISNNSSSNDLIIYMRYYFDFASAIETINRNIILKKYNDDFVITKLKAGKEKTSFFIADDLERLLVSVDENYKISDVKNFYASYIGIIDDRFYNKISLNKKIKDYKGFIECYKTSRETRNLIAHSLVLSSIKFNNDMLFNFMISFFLLYQYYVALCSE